MKLDFRAPHLVVLSALQLFCSGCLRVSNSFSGDEILTASPAMRVFVRTLNNYECLRCHPGYSSYVLAQDWIDAGLIVPGDSASSVIIKRLRGTESGLAVMPPTGSYVDEASIVDIEYWIDNETSGD